MGTQPAQRVAVKRNTLQRMCAIHRELIYQISGLYKHPQQQNETQVACNNCANLAGNVH